MQSSWRRAFDATNAAVDLERSRLPIWWRAIGYGAAVVAFLLLVAVAWLYPDFNRTDTPDWRPVLALADAAWKKGDLYEARHLYVQVDRIAAWHQDWRGLVAAACGIKRLDGARGVYSKAFQILLRALIAAQNEQSRAGFTAVADVFSALGEQKAAEMALAQIRHDWPQEMDDTGEFDATSC